MTKYNFWIGLGKSIKNNAFVLIPFFIAVFAGLPEEHAAIGSVIVYFLKNLYEFQTKKLKT